MLSKVSRWLQKKHQSPRPGPRSTRRAQPRVEQLEDRLAPAGELCTFTPGVLQGGARGPHWDDYWSDSANWYPAPPDGSGTDSVTVSRPANGTAGIVDVSADVAALSLSSGGALVVNSPLTVGSGGTYVSGAPLTVNSQLQTDNINADGGTVINSGGELDITGSGANAFGPVSNTTIDGTLKAPNGATVSLLGNGSLTGTLGAGPSGDSTFTFGATSSWTVSGNGTFQGGHYLIYGPLTINNDFTPSAANITLDTDGQGGGGTNGSITGTGGVGPNGGGSPSTSGPSPDPFNLWDTFTWNGGLIAVVGGFYINAPAAFTATSNQAKVLGGPMINNSMSTVLTGTGTLNILAGATFTNSSGIVTVSLPLIFGDGTFVNSAVLQAVQPASTPTVISSGFNNTNSNGNLQVSPNVLLTLNDVNPSGPVHFLDGILQLSGELDLQGGWSAPTGLDQDGTPGWLEILNRATLTVPGGQTFTVGGNTEVQGGGTLNGAGQLTVSTGKLVLDLNSAASAGSFTMQGPGTLVVQWGGPTSFSSLAVTGLAQLSGTLEVAFVGFQPVAGDSFVPLTYGSRLNQFDTITEPTNPPEHQPTASYGPNALTLTQT